MSLLRESRISLFCSDVLVRVKPHLSIWPSDQTENAETRNKLMEKRHFILIRVSSCHQHGMAWGIWNNHHHDENIKTNANGLILIALFSSLFVLPPAFICVWMDCTYIALLIPTALNSFDSRGYGLRSISILVWQINHPEGRSALPLLIYSIRFHYRYT